MTTLQERDIRNYIQELQEEGHSDAAAWLATLLTSHQRNQADTDG